LISLITISSLSNVNAACDPPCSSSNDKEFCGVDDICHEYSCNNWYQYGDMKYTRYQNLSAPALECQDINTNDNDDDYIYLARAGIIHGCSTATGDLFPFTKECFAKFNEQTNFTCREMSSNTNFTSYIDNMNEKNITCSDDRDPIYLYVNWLGFDTYLGQANFNTMSVSSTFNETLSMKTMYALSMYLSGFVLWLGLSFSDKLLYN
jgi:hypothetical protein